MGGNLLLRLQLLTLVVLVAIANLAQQPPAQVVRPQDIDHSVKPGQDFYRFANGGWLKKATPAAGQSSLDIRTMQTQRNTQRVRDLIREAAASRSAKGSIEQKVGDYYASFMD